MTHARDVTAESYADWLWLSVLPLALFVILCWGLITVPLPWQLQLEWIPSLGIELSWNIDALSAQFLVLITGIGTMVFIYASGYLSHTRHAGRFFAVMLLFMAAMIGAVSADHMLVMFVCWELTSLTSFFLVGFNHSSEQARSSARQALFITLGGGLALLAGLILLSQITGSWSLQAISSSGTQMLDHPLLPAALIFIFIGCFTKSAQFPFHFWLPNAMSAPTPASAYLHSATMVKLGIYLLARLDPVFNDLLLWEITLISVGTITAVWAAILALRERDLKRILARSTVSALGTLVLLIGIPNEQASVAVIAFLFAHALYKAPLFFVAGNIDHATGTRSIDHLMGLKRYMPLTMIAAILASLSMAGLPLSFGYVAKGIVNAAKSEAELLMFVSYGLLFVNAVAVAVAAVAAIRVFWGPVNPGFEKVHEVSWRMLLPPLLIAAIGLEFEFLPTIADPLLFDAARVIAPSINMDNLNTDNLSDSILTVAELALFVGALLFIFWEQLHRMLSGIKQLDRFGPGALFDHMLNGLSHAAAWHTKALQHGKLDTYMRLTFTVFILLCALAWFSVAHEQSLFSAGLLSIDGHTWALITASVFIMIGALAAPFLQDRLALLMSIGVVGYGSAILFLFAGAPDVAFTQFMVETVLVVLAAAVLPHYGVALQYREPRLLNATVAIAAGAGTFLLLMHLFSLPADMSLAKWYAEHSLSDAHGRNIVNVVLVDFRALDTFGEVTVVTFSALAAWPLLRKLKQHRGRS